MARPFNLSSSVVLSIQIRLAFIAPLIQPCCNTNLLACPWKNQKDCWVVVKSCKLMTTSFLQFHSDKPPFKTPPFWAPKYQIIIVAPSTTAQHLSWYNQIVSGSLIERIQRKYLKRCFGDNQVVVVCRTLTSSKQSDGNCLPVSCTSREIERAGRMCYYCARALELI